MVTEIIIQLYKVREVGDFLNLSEEDECYEFALRSPFSFERFAALVQFTCPSLNKFGLVRLVKSFGTQRVLVPLSEKNFTEAVTGAIQQDSSHQGAGQRPSLRVCAWEKASTSNAEDPEAGSHCSSFKNGHSEHIGKSQKSDLTNLPIDSERQGSNTARSDPILQLVDAGAGMKQVDNACKRPERHQDSFRNTSVAIGGNLRHKPVRRALARFVKHVNFDDHATVYAGAPFVKIWRVRNDSSAAWPEKSFIMAVGGESMMADSAPKAFPVHSLMPGEEQNIEIPLVAPTAPGKYQGFYRFCSSEGKKFGQRLSCQIMVVDGVTTASESTSSDSSTDESSGDDLKLRRDKSNKTLVSDAKRRAKRKQRLDRKKRKLEKKAKKLSRKLKKIEKRLWKIKQAEELVKMNEVVPNHDIEVAYPVAIPAVVNEQQNSAMGSSKASDGKEEAIVAEAMSCLDMRASPVEKNHLESIYQQLLSLGFSGDQVRSALSKNGGDVVECLKDLTK